MGFVRQGEVERTIAARRGFCQDGGRAVQQNDLGTCLSAFARNQLIAVDGGRQVIKTQGIEGLGVQGEIHFLGVTGIAGLVGLAQLHFVDAVGAAVGGGCAEGAAPTAEAAAVFLGAPFQLGARLCVGGRGDIAQAGDAIGVVASYAGVGGERSVGREGLAAVEREAQDLSGAGIARFVDLAHLNRVAAIGTAIGGRGVVIGAPVAERASALLHTVLHDSAGFGIGWRGDARVVGDAIGVEACGAVRAVGGERGVGHGHRGV